MIEETLTAWGKWSRTGVLPQQPKCAVGRLIASAPDPDDPAALTLAEAERVDAAMLALKRRHPNIYAVLMARYYFGNTDDKAVGRRMSMGERTVRDLRCRGHMFVEAMLLQRVC